MMVMNLNVNLKKNSKKKVLFLCTGNSCRSQMAEGWCRHFWNDKFECYSAGTKKHGMNKFAVKVMKDASVDISSHYSKTTDELPKVNFDYIITVCDAAKEVCPFFHGGKFIHMGFQDPPFLTKDLNDENQILKIYSQVRDEIKNAIIKLPEILETTNED